MTPQNYEPETTSLWRFPYRGDWATHDSKYRGNWSPYIPRNLIERYTKKGDTILDQFAGGGTTLVEAKLLNRNCIGIDINDYALERCRRKIAFNCGTSAVVEAYRGNALDLSHISDNSIDMICTHPPYADIIRYSDSTAGDISRLPHSDFLKSMRVVANESLRVLKKGKVCAFMVGDIRKQGNVIPLGFLTMQVFVDAGFRNKEIVIKEQFNCRSSSYWTVRAQEMNFFLLAHEYIFVLAK